MTSSSVTFLFKTSRNLCVPASAVMVNPVFFTRPICSITSSVTVAGLNEGREREIFLPEYRFISPERRGPIFE